VVVHFQPIAYAHRDGSFEAISAFDGKVQCNLQGMVTNTISPLPNSIDIPLYCFQPIFYFESVPMASARYLTGDPGAINDFIDRFDVCFPEFAILHRLLTREF